MEVFNPEILTQWFEMEPRNLFSVFCFLVFFPYMKHLQYERATVVRQLREGSNRSHRAVS